MTYAELVTAIGNWAHRSDLAALAPTFIALAEERFNRTLRLNAFADLDTITILSGASSVALPADYLEGRAVTAADGEWTQCTPEQLAQRRSAGSADKAYAIFGGSLHVPLVVSEDTGLTLAYWTKVPALTSLATSNWLSINHPGVYLWTTLAEVAVYVNDTAQLQVFETRAGAAMDELRRAEESARYFAAALQPDYQL